MYLFDRQRLNAGNPPFEEALAEAHAAHRRPLCLCRPGGVPMYVARLGDVYFIKRMPYTGSQHAPACPSYELADVLDEECAAQEAIVENPETGLTTLRLGFALTRWEGRSIDRTPGD